MRLETVTLKLPLKLLSDASVVAWGQDVAIGYLVRHLLAKEIDRRLHPKTPNRADEGLVAALQALLARDIAEAVGWQDLAGRLRQHGYELRASGGGLALYKLSWGTRLCKGSERGFPYRKLVDRFQSGMPDHPHGCLGLNSSAAAMTAKIHPTSKTQWIETLAALFGQATDWEGLSERLVAYN